MNVSKISYEKNQRGIETLISDFRKGQVNIISVIIIISIVAVVSLLAFQIFSDLNTEIQSSDDFPTISKENSQQLTDDLPTSFDSIVLGILIVSIILIIVSAFMSKFNSIFIYISIFLLLGILIIPMLITNVWQDMIESSDVVVEESFPMTNFIMNYFPFIYLAILIMYGFALLIGDRIS